MNGTEKRHKHREFNNADGKGEDGQQRDKKPGAAIFIDEQKGDIQRACGAR